MTSKCWWRCLGSQPCIWLTMCAHIIKLENLPEQLVNILCPAPSLSPTPTPLQSPPSPRLPHRVTQRPRSSSLPIHQCHRGSHFFFDTMTQPRCWGNAAWLRPSQSPDAQQCHCPSGQPQREHSGARRTPETQSSPQRDCPATVHSPGTFPPAVCGSTRGWGSWFQGWRIGTESCHPWTKVTVWLSWVFLNISSSLNCCKLCVRETSAERGGKDGLNLDPISEAGPGLGWAGESGKGEPGPEQWVGLGSS